MGKRIIVFDQFLNIFDDIAVRPPVHFSERASVWYDIVLHLYNEWQTLEYNEIFYIGVFRVIYEFVVDRFSVHDAVLGEADIDTTHSRKE